MKIRVTEKHIKQGKRGRVTLCPIALALKETFACKVDVPADGDTDDFGNRLPLKVGEHEFLHPPVVDKFIKEFDRGDKVRPFEFELDFGKIA